MSTATLFDHSTDDIWAAINAAVPIATASQPAQPHPFEGMSFDSEDDPRDDDLLELEEEEEDDDDQDADYVEEGFQQRSTSSYTIPPPIPTHSRPKGAPAPKLPPSIPVANAQHRGTVNTRAIFLPASNPAQKNRPRPARKVSVPTPPLIASSRPSNVRRAGQPSHRATLSIGSSHSAFGGPNGADTGDPSIPDPNEEGIVFVSGAQAMNMVFLDFQPNMFLVRQDLTESLYPSFLEPPSKLTPLRCLICKKVYNGPNARSMWRRHITQKHGFTLGGKKGNGKGKKENMDDENKFPGESAEELALRRRQHSLQVKRDWARNHRMEVKASSSPDAPLQPNTVANTPYFFQERASVGHTGLALPVAQPPTFWKSDNTVSLVRTGIAPSAVSNAADEEDEDDVLSAAQLAPAHSPAVPSPVAFTSLAPPITSEPELVKDEEDEAAIEAQLGFKKHARLSLESDFDFFDFSFGSDTTAVDNLTTSPVVPMSHGFSGMYAAANSSALDFLSKVHSTPGRGLSEEERRRLILSLESPTSFPDLARHKSSNAVPTKSFATPARATTMVRSATTSSVPLSAVAASENLRDILNTSTTTPGRPTSGLADFLPTPFKEFKSMWDTDSPVLKRKRVATDDGVLTSITNAEGYGFGYSEGVDFEQFLNLGDSPVKSSDNAERAAKRTRTSL